GASEALAVFLLLAALASWDPHRRSRLFVAGCWLTLACAVRYDAWLWAAVLALLTAGVGKGFRERSLNALALSSSAALFPLVWLWGNAKQTGDPLAPIL